MIFTFKKWERFCSDLKASDLKSIPACEIKSEDCKYVVLKHDVETDVLNALKMAEIEKRYGHRGSYYVQAYLLNNPKNIELLKKIQSFGNEVSYHYDVLDSCKGDIDKAIIEFEKYKSVFEDNGFVFSTVCQHGNPIVERVGYHSNRDFFRNEKVKEKYSAISDIMVDFKEKFNTDYTYYSDAGRKFKMIYDPINNDIENSDDKNIIYNDLNELLCDISDRAIISTHPHRWTVSAVKYLLQLIFFKSAKTVAKALVKIPLFKRIMSRYYYLAKKI